MKLIAAFEYFCDVQYMIYLWKEALEKMIYSLCRLF